MAHILIAHEDGLLRARYRELYEQEGHTVTELSSFTDRDYLPKDLVFDRMHTTLDPLPDDPAL